MKSKISLFNKAVFKRNIIGNWFLWAALLVFYLLPLPLNLHGSLADMEYNGSALLPGMPEYQAVKIMWNMGFFVPFFALAAVLCAMSVFSYLFTGRNSNMMHTYPVSRVSLFVTNYVTGILFLLIPVLLSALLTLAVGAAHGALSSSVVKYGLLWMATVSVENLFFFSMAVCVLMFAGNIIAVPVLYLILNFLYEGCIFIAETMVSTICYGLEPMRLRGLLGVFTPIIYLIRVGVHEISCNGSDVQGTLDRMNTLPGYFAAAVLFAVIALAAYQKKHIETAGDVITVKWLKPIFRWGAAVCTSALGALFFSSLLYNDSFFVIISIVAVIGIFVFFFAQMLLERSVHIFTKNRIRECVIYTAVVCVCYLALDMDVLGLEKKIPAVNEIQAVRTRGSIQLLGQDEEEISWVHDIHSQIIASRTELKRRADDNIQMIEYLSLEYLLKDGSTFRRSYKIPAADEAGSVSAQIQDYANKPEVILKRLFGIHYPDIEIYGGKWSVYPDGGKEDGKEDVAIQEVRVSEADAKQLYEALVSDVSSGKTTGETGSSPETAETVETIGDLVLELRDEAGYVSVLDYYSVLDSSVWEDNKDGEAYVNVDKRYSCLLEKLHELGYLSDERYEQAR